ncbi:MAG: YceI family protein [Phycisphaerales bacterium]
MFCCCNSPRAASILLCASALTIGGVLMARTGNAQETARPAAEAAQATPAAKPAAPAAKPADAAPAGKITATIDDVHSMALFRVQHMGAGAFWGRFNDVSGTFTFTPGSTDGMLFDVTIKADSVDSGNNNLNTHLRSPDFFAAKDFPTLTFKSTGAKKTGENTFDLMGDLTIRGVTKPVTAKLEYVGMANMGMGVRAGFEATFTIKRSEFGVKYGVDKGAVGDDVRVIVGLEGTVGDGK